MSTVTMQGNGRSRKVWLLAIGVSVVFVGLWVGLRVLFPWTADYQELIRTADRVEVRAYLINNETRGTDFLVITDPGEIATLAKSIQITGIWIPLDELVANSYRIRVIGKGDTTDIVIRGGNRIRHGTVWHAAIGEEWSSTIRDLVRRHGGVMPNWKEMLPARPTTHAIP